MLQATGCQARGALRLPTDHVVCARTPCGTWTVGRASWEKALCRAGGGVGGLGNSRECSRQGGSLFTGTEVRSQPERHQCVAVGSWGQWGHAGASTGRAGLWFLCQAGFTHPWSRALTDKRAGSGALAGPRHSGPFLPPRVPAQGGLAGSTSSRQWAGPLGQGPRAEN